MIERKDLVEYIEGTTPNKARQLAMVMANMMSDDQMKAISTRFSTKLNFELDTKPKAEKEEKQEGETPDDPMAGIDLD